MPKLPDDVKAWTVNTVLITPGVNKDERFQIRTDNVIDEVAGGEGGEAVVAGEEGDEVEGEEIVYRPRTVIHPLKHRFVFWSAHKPLADFNTDKISQLPDDILLKFLSTLDLKTAMRTSILGKNWRYLWTWRTDLDLDSSNMSPGKSGLTRYSKWVNQIINAHRSPFITKFRVVFDKTWSKDKSLVEKWVRFALSKRVEELELTLELFGAKPNPSLGLDILKHPLCYNGIVNLKSLYLTNVHVSGEFLEFILLHCRHLERLFVYKSKDVHTLNIVSNTLKHLTLMSCYELKELEIDAVNLISFMYEDLKKNCKDVRAQLVFKSVPNLVEIAVSGVGCFYPFPILEEISYLPKQLTKLSFRSSIQFHSFFDKGPREIHVQFPKVNQLTFTLPNSWTWLGDVFIKLFIGACPMLQELTIHPVKIGCDFTKEAKQLRDIELENEGIDEISRDQNSNSAASKEQVANHVDGDEFEVKSYPNLKVLEIVDFCGGDGDVTGALDIITAAPCIEKLICNMGSMSIFRQYVKRAYDVESADIIMLRARKLAILVPPNVHVGVVNTSGLFWLS